MSVVAWSRPTRGGVIFAEATSGRELLGAGGGITFTGTTRDRALLGTGGDITLVGAARLHKTRAECVGSATETEGSNGNKVGTGDSGGCETIEGGVCWRPSRRAVSTISRVGPISSRGESNAGRGRRPRLVRGWSTAAIIVTVMISMLRPVDGMWRSRGGRGAKALFADSRGGGVCDALSWRRVIRVGNGWESLSSRSEAQYIR